MPYLIIKDAQAFIEFMQIVFNAEVKLLVPREEGLVMHGELTIGKAALMFASATDIYHPQSSGMFFLTEKVDEIYQRALENGGVSLQQPGERGYGHTAGFRDPFENHWWLTMPGN